MKEPDVEICPACKEVVWVGNWVRRLGKCRLCAFGVIDYRSSTLSFEASVRGYNESISADDGNYNISNVPNSEPTAEEPSPLNRPWSVGSGFEYHRVLSRRETPTRTIEDVPGTLSRWRRADFGEGLEQFWLQLLGTDSDQ